jgi:hypothetical protein
VKREEAIALLKELAANQVLQPFWISMLREESGEFELHIKPETYDSAGLKLIAEKHNLTLKEDKGHLIVH